jgi:hypothetical protein
MVIVISIIYTVIATSSAHQSTFFRVGPHDDFLFFAVKINTYGKYFSLATYSCLNSVVRTVHKNIVLSAMYNNILNKSNPPTFNALHSSEIASVATLYGWFDWFIYMNLTLSQIDMMTIEVVSDTLTSIATAMIFMSLKKRAIYATIKEECEE